MTATPNTAALQALLERVGAGADHIDVLGAANVWAYAHGHAGLYVYVIDAFTGSLDAAKALHEAVLPGWHMNLIIGAFGDCAVLLSRTDPRWRANSGTQFNPARAWLIAILRALSAPVAENEGGM